MAFCCRVVSLAVGRYPIIEIESSTCPDENVVEKEYAEHLLLIGPHL